MNPTALGADLIDVFAGGRIDTDTSLWLQQRHEQLRTTVSQTAATFFDHARSLYSMISATDAMQVLRNLKAKVTEAWSNNEIAYLNDLARIQTAGPVMQRWIMAQPDLRQRYLSQEVEGYEGSYVNYQGDTIGAVQYDWRRVMDEIVVVNDEGFKFVHYYDNIPEGDRELTLFEKVDILRTWALVENMVEEGDDDPTSICGNKL